MEKETSDKDETLEPQATPVKSNGKEHEFVSAKYFNEGTPLKHHVVYVGQEAEKIYDFDAKSPNAKMKIKQNLKKSFELGKDFFASPAKYKGKSPSKNYINSVHLKSKPFKCQICDKKFGLERSLKVHNTVVHKKKKNVLKSFECT